VIERTVIVQEYLDVDTGELLRRNVSTRVQSHGSAKPIIAESKYLSGLRAKAS